jgi:ABC-type multidrug transport system permease subunit
LLKKEKARISELLDSWENSAERSVMLKSIAMSPYAAKGIPATIRTAEVQADFVTQFKLLFVRSFKNQLRNPLAVRASLAQMIFFSTFMGLIYLRIGNDQGSVQDRMGSLFFFAVQGIMAAMSMNLVTFSVERDIFIREYFNGYYSLGAFFTSRVATELPFRIVFCWIYATIAYWMIGYKQAALNYFVFFFLVLGVDICGQNMGKAIATGFPNVNVGTTRLHALCIFTCLSFRPFVTHCLSISRALFAVGVFSQRWRSVQRSCFP